MTHCDECSEPSTQLRPDDYGMSICPDCLTALRRRQLAALTSTPAGDWNYDTDGELAA